MIEDIVIAGVGQRATGFKEVFLPRLIAVAAFNHGLPVLSMEIGGDGVFRGSVVYFVRIGGGAYSNLIPEGGADLIIGLEPLETLRATVKYAKDTVVVTEVNPRMPPASVNFGRAEYPSVESLLTAVSRITGKVYCVDALRLAKRLGRLETLNTVVMGAATSAAELPVTVEAFEEALVQSLPERASKYHVEAFRAGREACKEWKAIQKLA